MDFHQRVDQPEWMDTITYPPSVMEETLSFLAVTNRFFGGTKVILNYLEPWLKAKPTNKPITILDVGTGGAEIPIALVKWAGRNGLRLQVTAIDMVEEVVSIAKNNTRNCADISVRQEDFFALAKNKETFDYVITSLFLHHIPPSSSCDALQALDQLATRGVIVSDLFRSPASYWSVKSLSALIGNHVVRHDGPLSVRRSFTPNELNELATSAGLPYLKARREPWFRVSFAGEKIPR
jgi:2-polyprenyl-3-methyl-5-hydroxy-6-metoxy-1,4-benzoquinol methylase